MTERRFNRRNERIAAYIKAPAALEGNQRPYGGQTIEQRAKERGREAAERTEKNGAFVYVKDGESSSATVRINSEAR